MNVVTSSLVETARSLRRIYTELDALKYERPRPPEARVMKPTFGPRPPANITWLSLDALHAGRLQALVYQAAADVDRRCVVTQNGADLCDWIINHAPELFGTWQGQELEHEMRHQVDIVGQRIAGAISPERSDEILKHADPWGTAVSIANTTSLMLGRRVTREQVKSVGRAERFKKRHPADGATQYRLAEMLHHFRQQATAA